ncbi:MAG: tRNA preQ1(34) S-adenosylmethionine ribosyltransferase-isomerase QueA [Deltaproteobacteria bacterium]|nr:MAG: tRNA preQ1(34) S-adenosylmethionine ribosyltransferase-isomerase QueA [Deltaproteobacteria bacterium]
MYCLEDYNYHLPAQLIAQEPALKRDESRLLCVKRSTGQIADYCFYDLPSLLREGDLLVVNDAKVAPAKLYGQKETGGRVEILILEHPVKPPKSGQDIRWCLVKASKRPTIGSNILFPHGLVGIVTGLGANGRVQLKFEGKQTLNYVLKKRGCLPLPPYIKRENKDRRSDTDRERYQTIFSHFSGAVAAPTAGLHFTHGLLKALQSAGVDIVSITLLVGHDTFRPVRVKDIREHHLGKEPYFVGRDAATSIERAKVEGRRIIAVGSTVVRTLETIWKKKGEVVADSGTTDLLIYPGFDFQVTDALITNFHLPRSSLLFLVAAFTGLDLTMKTYQWAVERRYRFYSYGDAMMII